jgi:hypothetical protein
MNFARHDQPRVLLDRGLDVPGFALAPRHPAVDLDPDAGRFGLAVRGCLGPIAASGRWRCGREFTVSDANSKTNRGMSEV